MTIERPQTIGRRAGAAGSALLAAAGLWALCLCGCAIRGYLPPEQLPYAKLAIPYESTQLGTSTTLDVLSIARNPNYQFARDKADEVLLTQGDAAIAFSGRSEDKSKTWVNIVVFDEYRLTATRKYFFLVDERMEVAPTAKKHLLIPPRRGIVFDAQFVLDPQILTTPYATEAARRIAILRNSAEQFQRDVAVLLGNPHDPAQGSASISVAAMMMGQTFTGLLIELDKSPGLAQNLTTERGVEFPHINLNKGRVRLFDQGNVAAVTIRVNLPLQ